ncbi:hypothetical protein [Paraburkholderia rhynchosiae]|uniref:Uncharacterized protein n=1 Tax=Paraburkholderia rhynchosiae TaxID=487049 RepID=A0A2N7WBX8_9BURK|nr:hypothetical protein [Paraburkholderia rhynchosiae]PMS26909.1 hypothetical protein C0Z16_25915 [Paraburkholderia rhynchosiae]CAB3726855.1 hypothetical protein LMG27174_05442 [Paraburkholderia rhynchosiae]
MTSKTEIILAVADFFALSAPPALMVALVFAAAYLLIGVPLHFWRGAVARDTWGTLAGLFAGLLYMAFIFGIYPNLRDDLHVIDAKAASAHQRQ